MQILIVLLIVIVPANLWAAFVPIENIDPGGVAASAGGAVTQLYPNVFTASKTLPYYEADGSIKNADTLHFVCEKLDFGNLFRLYDYVNEQNQALDRGDVAVPGAVIAVAKEAMRRFTYSLDLVFLSSQAVLDEFDKGTPEEPTAQLTKWRDDFEYCNETRDSSAITSLNYILSSSVFDIWVAYCTREDPSVTWPIDYNTQAEMLLTFMGSSSCPFDTHLGVSRNCRIFYADARPHINLSIQIGGFAMLASAQAYGAPKNYMITRAVSSNAKALMAYFESKGITGAINYPADMQASADQSDPDTLYATYPLNNLDDNNWLLLPRGETIPVSFPRPRWFPVGDRDSRKVSEHFYLNNIFDRTLAVYAAAFADYWNAAY